MANRISADSHVDGADSSFGIGRVNQGVHLAHEPESQRIPASFSNRSGSATVGNAVADKEEFGSEIKVHEPQITPPESRVKIPTIVLG